MDRITELVFYTARKATAAFLLATAAGIGTSLLDGHLTKEEALVALGVGLLTATGVYAAPKNTASV